MCFLRKCEQEVVETITTDSRVEVLMRAGTRLSFDGGYLSHLTDRKVITVVKCSSCGKIRHEVTDI